MTWIMDITSPITVSWGYQWAAFILYGGSRYITLHSTFPHYSRGENTVLCRKMKKWNSQS